MLRFGPETNELTRAAPRRWLLHPHAGDHFFRPFGASNLRYPISGSNTPPMVHVVPCGCLPLSIVRQTPLLAREISEPLSQDLAGESDEPIIFAGSKNPSISSV